MSFILSIIAISLHFMYKSFKSKICSSTGIFRTLFIRTQLCCNDVSQYTKFDRASFSLQDEFQRKLDTLRDEQSSYTSGLEQQVDALQLRLREVQQEAELAVQERDLQKMAALSHSDAARDELSEKLERMQAEATEEREKLRAALGAAREEVEALNEELASANRRAGEVRRGIGVDHPKMEIFGASQVNPEVLVRKEK